MALNCILLHTLTLQIANIIVKITVILHVLDTNET